MSSLKYLYRKSSNAGCRITHYVIHGSNLCSLLKTRYYTCLKFSQKSACCKYVPRDLIQAEEFCLELLVCLHVCNSSFKGNKNSIVDKYYAYLCICSFLDVYEDTGRRNQSIWKYQSYFFFFIMYRRKHQQHQE